MNGNAHVRCEAGENKENYSNYYLSLYFLIYVKTKEDAKLIKNKIEHFINTYLHLEFNHKSRYYPSAMGVNFCGYRIYKNYRLLRNSSKDSIRKKMKMWNKLWYKGNLNYEKAMQSLNSWYGHIKHCNSYRLKVKYTNKCDFLYTSKTMQNDINYLYSLYNNIKNN